MDLFRACLLWVSHSWWEPAFIPSGREWEASMTYSERSHPACSCWWDGARSLSLPWWCGPCVSTSLPKYWHFVPWYDGPGWCFVSPLQTSRGVRDMFWWCSLTLMSVELLVFPMYTFPHLQGTLYTHGIFRARPSLVGQRKQESVPGRRPTT
jgi:hypothetical protein